MLSAFPTWGRFVVPVVLGLVLVCSLSLPAPAQPQRLLAPELTGGVGWLGTEKPLLLKDLRGKFVVFDFWTLC